MNIYGVRALSKGADAMREMFSVPSDGQAVRYHVLVHTNIRSMCPCASCVDNLVLDNVFDAECLPYSYRVILRAHDNVAKTVHQSRWLSQQGEKLGAGASSQ